MASTSSSRFTTATSTTPTGRSPPPQGSPSWLRGRTPTGRGVPTPGPGRRHCSAYEADGTETGTETFSHGSTNVGRHIGGQMYAFDRSAGDSWDVDGVAGAYEGGGDVPVDHVPVDLCGRHRRADRRDHGEQQRRSVLQSGVLGDGDHVRDRRRAGRLWFPDRVRLPACGVPGGDQLGVGECGNHVHRDGVDGDLGWWGAGPSR